MRPRQLLQRVGLTEDRSDPRFAWKIVLAVCIAYSLPFLVFYPDAITNDDEAMYLRQAHLVLEGRATLTKIDALTGEQVEHNPSLYNPGTAVLMAPFVGLFGWRGAYLVPWLCLMGGTLLLARLLQDEKRSPLWSLYAIGFLPALVLGRVAMSDLPSFFVVTLGVWLFFRGLDRGFPWWLGAGFVAGASWSFRESNPLLFAPLFAGTVLRRETKCWALVVGGLVGISLRLLANQLIHGEMFYFKDTYYLDLDRLPDRLPLYALTLLVLFPGGFVFALLYKGRRRVELGVSVVLFVGIYMMQTFYMWGSSLAKNAVLTARYMTPLAPLFALAAAEVLPRLWQGLRQRLPATRHGVLEAVSAALLVVWIGGIAVASIAVHPYLSAWSSTQRGISEAIRQHTDPGSVMVTNLMATRKFLAVLDSRYLPVKTASGVFLTVANPPPPKLLTPEDTTKLVARHGEVFIVLLDRSDGSTGRYDSKLNAEYMASIASLQPVLTFDERFSPTDHLRIWRLGERGSP